ncbi:MAG: hypothetical protein J6Y54_06095 [Lentisphaeria bacterium]|nr:hypothetical protein [Lentisphaeria bacterium]
MAEVVNFQERIAAGDIPTDAAELTIGCKQLLRVNSRVSQTIAVCVARMYETQDLREWVRWCKDELGLESVSYRSHLAKVGKLLLNLTRSECDLPTYTRLFGADVMKLLALARVPESEVVAFLSHNPDFERISRDELRRRVADWLGEGPGEDAAPEQPELPGFDEMVSDVLAWEPGALVAQVHDADAAGRSRQAGLLFLAAGLEYEKSREIPDVAALQEIKTALLSEVEDIENVIAKTL